MFDGSTIAKVLPWLLGAAGLVVSAVAAAHVILNKRDVRAAIGWTGLILFSPFFGALAYYLLGINRIRRRAARIGSPGRPSPRRLTGGVEPVGREAIARRFGEHLGTLSQATTRATGAPLLPGNSVRPLIDGDEAYPAMLEAIGGARRSVALASYIFDNDHAGRAFVEALAAAADRGVRVRVLVDSVGARGGRPRITRTLRAAGVTAAEFLPTRLPWANTYMNLRNHRKMLIVDGRVGFVGGMNIREGCLLARPSRHPIRDLHFRVEGPVVEAMFRALAQDWTFSTGERLDGAAWEMAPQIAGEVVARGIADGPDEDFETLRWTLLAGVDLARESVRVVTPYFLPDAALSAALDLAAMRGVRVDIVLPERNNLRLVQWACMAVLWQVLEAGCRVWLTPPPFDHSKVMVVDDAWSLIGSANWDPRSLRLNFEYNVECYDRELAGRLAGLVDEKIAQARPLTLAEVDGRTFPVRLRDGVARLFSPYL